MIKTVCKFVSMFFCLIVILCFSGCKKHMCEAGEWIYPTSIKCEQEYEIYKQCNECNEILEEKKLTKEHVFKENKKEPTCCDGGYIDITCENCNYFKREILDSIEHDLSETKVESTCSTEGYVEYKCTTCTYSKKENLPLKEHDLEEEVKEPLCSYIGYKKETCKNCDYVKLLETYPAAGHDYIYEDKEPTCSVDGYHKETCSKCDYVWELKKNATGHLNVDEIIECVATDESYGIKQLQCKDCFEIVKTIEYANNGFSRHGKLSVDGSDLVNQYGEKVQLIGLSTHGLQWAGKYVNYDTFKAIRDSFGINVIRLSLYTSEKDGYCTGGDANKEKLYNLVVKGIEYATQLDMYVVVDWHMLGAEDDGDKNPLYYLNESMDFFDKITKLYKDNENILFEIMNEPNDPTTWQDCKDYANKVIPVIRKNNDGIVLVGNPRWTADLYSVMKDPLTGYENIMYTYHFYAADHPDTTQVVEAYLKGFPVFISEHGGMNSDGYGQINYDYIKNWYNVLNAKNISYIAWNISNTECSASILKYNNSTLTEFNSTNMKYWGNFYREQVRSRFGLPVIKN